MITPRSLPYPQPPAGRAAPGGSSWRELTFKVADRPEEREQIHRLNHRTFAGEIPQHQPSADGRLVDKFDTENTYLISLDGDRLIGMIALRGERPFSLDGKLPDLAAHLPPHRAACELRLLSVDPAYRSGRVLLGLMGLIHRHCRERGYDLGLISGTTRQQKLYRRLGFLPFGPLVGTGEARFQPMYLTLHRAETEAIPLLDQLPVARDAPSATPVAAFHPSPARPVNLLPGPVSIAPAVAEAFRADPVSHRSEAFLAVYRQVRARLCRLVGADSVALLHGSGTLANDAVAARLAGLGRPGLVLSNGEFGERLVDAAGRAGLRFATLSRPEGERIEAADVAAAMAEAEEVAWVWLVHCETSTGVLNDLSGIRDLGARGGTLVCVDAISSIGTVAVDLGGIAMASGVGGKGLGSYAGLAMVFAGPPLDRPLPGARPVPTPRYLDLAAYAGDAPPFTVPSNLVFALAAALDRLDDPGHLERIARASLRVRSRLVDVGFGIVAPAAHGSPAVLTIEMPAGGQAGSMGDALRDRGYLVSYESGYLRARNRLQLCLMGDIDPAALEPLPALMATLRDGIAGGD